MPNRPQFSLKAILVIVAVLSVPLAMFATRNGLPRLWGVVLLFPILGGCVGYLAGGGHRAGTGIAIGILASIVFACLWPMLTWAVVHPG